MSQDEHRSCSTNEKSKNGNLDCCAKENSEFIVRHHAALLETTDNFLYDVLKADTYLSDLPYGCTHEEILAQIGLAKGQMITVFVERNGLPTLKIVVPQSSATVAQLKRSIKSTIILQQNRSAKLIKAKQKSSINKHENIQNDHDRWQKYNSQKNCVGNNVDVDHSDISYIPLPHTPMPPKSAASEKSSSRSTTSSLPSFNSAVVAAIRSGSATKRRRKFISWRLIWNTYVLCTVDSNRPLIDGRALLSDFGIGNKSVLKFVKRERIFGRQRRRSLFKRRKVYSFRRDQSSARNEPIEL